MSTDEDPDYFAIPEAPVRPEAAPSLAASLLAAEVMAGALTGTEALERTAQHFLTTTPEVEGMVVVLTLVPPTPTHGWSRIGERAWIREWVRPKTGYAAGPRLAEASSALTMPWVSQRSRRLGAAVVEDIRRLPAAAAVDKREASAIGARAMVTLALIGDEAMLGSIALTSTRPTAWPAEAVADGLLLRAAITGRIATERARDALADALARGDRALESQMQFFSVVEHDLRPPLVDLRASDDLGDAVACAIDHTLAVVDDVLLVRRELTRADRDWISVAAAVGDAVHWVRAAAGLRNVELEVEVDETLEVCTTGEALRQILVTLLDNAISRAAGGGSVRLVAALAAGDLPQPRVRLTVHDSGPALTLQEQDRLFRPTTRVLSALPGAGLGLSLSRTFAERDGGAVGAASGPDGAALWVELPGRGPGAEDPPARAVGSVP
ncbi:sensor histidine kinase [Nocardioides pantholopis]|uniref:sensor histidine kinase n=1 Tax=Nocardioides pantholopis TaxID=2483798 RepID=UPI000FDA5303|nr:HAMP domain-containing sensor histidine kinase [Nocardioides pantholopis]